MTAKLLTTAELAKALGLSVRTIQRYRSEGRLEPDEMTPGGHARWSEDRARTRLREIALESRARYED